MLSTKIRRYLGLSLMAATLSLASALPVTAAPILETLSKIEARGSGSENGIPLFDRQVSGYSSRIRGMTVASDIPAIVNNAEDSSRSSLFDRLQKLHSTSPENGI